MKIRHIICLFILSLFTIGPVEGKSQPPVPYKTENQHGKQVMNFLAVMDLNCGSGIDKDTRIALTDILINEIIKSKKYTVIDRATLNKALSEMRFKRTGCVDVSGAIEVGRALSVGKVVVGSISKVGETYMVNLQLLNVETAAVEESVSETCKCDLDGIMRTVQIATKKLMGASPASSPETDLQSKYKSIVLPTPPEKKQSLAVLDLRGVGGPEMVKMAATLSDPLRDEFVNTGYYKVCDRAHMEVVMNELKFNQSGCTSSECVVEVGRTLQVEKIVTGTVSKLGDTYVISLQMIDVATSVLEKSSTEKATCKEGELFYLVGIAAKKLLLAK